MPLRRKNPRKITAGTLIELCERCPDCGRGHPCGQETCLHDYCFAIEDEHDGVVTARFFLIGDRVIQTRGRGCRIISYAWAGWIPEEIEYLYEKWQQERGGGDYDDWEG